MKRCTKCDEVKSFSSFAKQTTAKDGYRWACKQCNKKERIEKRAQNKAYQQAYFANPVNHAKRIAWQQRHRLENADRLRAAYIEKHSIPSVRKKQIFDKIRVRCANLAKEFTITMDDFETPSMCPILGVPIDYALGQGHRSRYRPSIDRINNDLGYVPGNVQLISSKANTMKSDASPEELLNFAHWIIHTFGDDKN